MQIEQNQISQNGKYAFEKQEENKDCTLRKKLQFCSYYIFHFQLNQKPNSITHNK